MSGIYADNPRRATARPTAELMLENFWNITLTTVYVAGQAVIRHLTPLTSVQTEILSLLNLQASVYTNLTQFPLLSIAGFLRLFTNFQLWCRQPKRALA